MTNPQRITLSRRKGWRKPENAVVVSRPSRWGNVFRVFGQNEYLYCDASHRRHIFTPWVIFDQDQDIANNPATPAMAVEHFRRWVLGEFTDGIVRPCPFTVEDVQRELAGKSLACWCPQPKPGEPDVCHGAVLLKMAGGMENSCSESESQSG